MKAGESGMKIAHIYAQVLFELAEEQNLIDGIKEDFDGIEGIFVHEPEFKNFVNAPNFSESYKIELLEKLLRGKVNELTMNFIMTVIRHHRIMYLRRIVERYIELWLARNGYSIVEMTISSEIDSYKLAYFSQKIAESINKKVKLEVRVNPYIMGGAIIRYGDKVIDNSVRGRLNNAVNQILKNRKQ